MSASNYLTLAATVPVYNWLINNIEDFQAKQNELDDIKEATQKTIEKLKEYYIMIESSVYMVATNMFKYLNMIIL